MQHNFSIRPHAKRYSWMFNSFGEDDDVENEIILTDPTHTFDLKIERWDDGRFRYSVRKHLALNASTRVVYFHLAEEVGDYLYERGCTCAQEMIQLGIEALG